MTGKFYEARIQMDDRFQFLAREQSIEAARSAAQKIVNSQFYHEIVVLETAACGHYLCIDKSECLQTAWKNNA